MNYTKDFIYTDYALGFRICWGCVVLSIFRFSHLWTLAPLVLVHVLDSLTTVFICEACCLLNLWATDFYLEFAFFRTGIWYPVLFDMRGVFALLLFSLTLLILLIFSYFPKNFHHRLFSSDPRLRQTWPCWVSFSLFWNFGRFFWTLSPMQSTAVIPTGHWVKNSV